MFANLRMILNTYRIPIIGTPIKAQLVQMITNAVQQQPSRLNYIKQVLTQQLNESRRQQRKPATNRSNTSYIK